MPEKSPQVKFRFCSLCGIKVEPYFWHGEPRCPHCVAFLSPRDPYPPEAELGFGAKPHGTRARRAAGDAR